MQNKMDVKELKNKIGFQIGFLLYSGLEQEKVIENLAKIAIDYGSQFQYDFSKNCKCESRTGETWCCNQCGLPTTQAE